MSARLRHRTARPEELIDSAACTAGRREGAPIRRRRSLSDTNPPKAQSAAPSQIHGASGLR